MFLFWRIRYLDSSDRTFKDRDLILETDTLDPVNRAAVEYCASLDKLNNKEWLRFRPLFRVGPSSVEEGNALIEKHNGMHTVCLHDYFEDENGAALSPKRQAEILTGSDTAILLPPGAKPHDVQYMLADKPPVDLNQISLSPNDLETLGYFTRDLREMLATSFYRDGPGMLSGQAGGQYDLKTAATDTEIRSFVTIFRRLYMEEERGNFFKTVNIVTRVLHQYPIGQLIHGMKGEYSRALNEPPFVARMLGFPAFKYTHKNLIDVLIYTQYAHQPNAERVQQFEEYKAALGGQPGRLTWLMLAALHECGLQIRNAGVPIIDYYESYCRAHGVTVKIIPSIVEDNPGIGGLEKQHAREARLFQEAITKLATARWTAAGCPEGRQAEFEAAAKADLMAAMTKPPRQ